MRMIMVAMLAALALSRSYAVGPGDPAWDAAEREPAAAHLARPSVNQYAWHEQERALFIHFGVATWEGTEYDGDGRTDLSRIDPAAFDADALCLAAKSWGARQLLLVCKHVGGFTLWPTETTDYHIGRTPWRNGEGNMVREVAEACRRHGLKMGVYLYPDDTRFARGIGRSGRTDDPGRQEEWNRLYIRQWEEVLALCGPDLVNEVWLDGGCIIDIEPTIMRLAPRAVFFNGTKHEPIRWVGNERGIAPDINWNAIRREDLARGDDAHRASDPDGDTWAPVETNTTLYDHNWFWTSSNEARRKSVDHLMHLFVKSVGNGSTFLLNSSPDTSGRLPEGDVRRYAEFGEAIERNFGRPLARLEAPVVAAEAECVPAGPVTINCADVWEDYRLGHRIRAFVVEGLADGEWVKLASGEAVGRRKLVFFPPTTVDRVRLRVTRSVGTPVIRMLQVHRVDPAMAGSLIPPISRRSAATASSIHSAPYDAAMLVDGNAKTRWSAADSDPDPWVELDLGRPRKIARATISELADRVQAFQIEYRNAADEEWRIVHAGSTIGATWSADFGRVTARFVRLRILEYTGPAPTLWSWELFDRADAFESVGAWRAGEEGTWDLSIAINEAGRYEIRFVDDDGEPMRVISAQLFFDGGTAAPENLSGAGERALRLSRTQAIGPGASSRLKARIEAPVGSSGAVLLRPAP